MREFFDDAFTYKVRFVPYKPSSVFYVKYGIKVYDSLDKAKLFEGMEIETVSLTNPDCIDKATGIFSSYSYYLEIDYKLAKSAKHFDYTNLVVATVPPLWLNDCVKINPITIDNLILIDLSIDQQDVLAKWSDSHFATTIS